MKINGSTQRSAGSALALAAAITLTSAGIAAAAPVSSVSAGFEQGLQPFSGHIQTGVAGDSAWKQSLVVANSGSASAQGPAPNHVTDNWLTTVDELSIPPGNTTATLSFFHSFNFENGFDGGLFERSVDGGAFAEFAPADFVSGGPVATLSPSFGNPIGGHKAWTGISGGGGSPVFVHTLVNLSSYAGHDVKVRFRLGTDSSTGSAGWFVDDVDAAVRPEALTGAPVALGDTTADLGGSVNPHSTQTSFHVEYGLTSAYGSVAPAADTAVGNDATIHTLSQPVSGLTASTTYHYRVVATFAGGSSPGADQTFTTKATPPPPVVPDPDPVQPTDSTPPATPTPPVDPIVPPAFTGVVLETKAATVSKQRKVKLTLVCPAAAIGSCAGTDVLTTARKVRAAKGKKARVLVLGKGKFSIAPGATGTVTIKLSKAALKLLAGKRTLKARQTTAASDSRNVPVTTTGPLKLGRGAKRGRR